MIYRGTEIDGVVSQGDFVITEQGITTMQETFKIRHQMDLLSKYVENTREMLPSNITHKKYETVAYSEIFEPNGVKSLKNVFNTLAEEKNYPIYMHCAYGTDKTGTIAYLMGAVLGMDEVSLYKEWALSTFFTGGSFKAEMDEFVGIVKSFEGDTLQEKVCGYLLSIGITQEQLDSFKTIMLESK